jgi:trehalose 6-phosphate phosphatase
MCRSLFEFAGEVEDRIVQAPHLLLCLGFDGTLAPFVDAPNGASLPGQVRRLLSTLAQDDRISLTVLSGRERSDLQERVGIPGLIYAGNHGLELSGPGFLFVEPMAAACRGELQTLAEELTHRLRDTPGAVVEDKGLTISVHVRMVPASQRDEVRHQIRMALSRVSHPFVVVRDEKVFEIRPRVYWDKGTAVLCIKAQFGQPGTLVIYVGDDATDEDAFESLPDGITVKVDGNVPTAARYRLESLTEVRRFLEWVADILHRTTPQGGALVVTGSKH